MSSQASASSQTISLPKGGGAQHGMGEKFSPDLFTGTGNFTVPVALPPGRNGFQPQLSLAYSTGNGNGPFGLGWSLSVPGVSRMTSKGIPRYRDNPADPKPDVFILSGAEDLVPVDGAPPGAERFRPRTEGLFALIDHFHDANDYWRVQSKDGLTSFYGTEASAGDDPAVIAKPDDRRRVFAWKLSRTEDPFGNRIEYDYLRDAGNEGPHHWDQLYLQRIRYVDYTDVAGQTKYLVSVTFLYDNDSPPPDAAAAKERPDSFSEYRSGFEIRTRRRCKWVVVKTHSTEAPEQLVRAYEFVYLDERTDLPNLDNLMPLNGVSLLSQVNVIGYDDANRPARELPPLEFGYSRFEPAKRKFAPVTGVELPAVSLANPDYELVDLFGNGLPDILEMNDRVRYWRNLGSGKFDRPRSMSEAPAGLRLADSGVQLVDANGDGRTDLLVTNSEMSGYYSLNFQGGWDRKKSFQRYAQAPSFNLEDPEVRLVDLDGDSVTDAIRSGTRMECYFNDPHLGWQSGRDHTRVVERRALSDFPNVNFSDPRVKWADLSGDGLQDIVLIHDGKVEYWPNLGYGNWGKRLHMRNSPHFPFGYDPKRILVVDIDGDGVADIVYVEDRKVTLWINRSGNAWSAPIVISGTPTVSDMDGMRLTDLLGCGVSGLLWAKDAAGDGRPHYFFLDFTGGIKPCLLTGMNNNMGAVTKVSYAPSTKFYLADERKPVTRWKTPLPFPVQVVERVEVNDEISGGKLTTEYRYHHGYWDGAEREFRGFGMVEQLDTEIFDGYAGRGVVGDRAQLDRLRSQQMFSPPLLTRTWFHQGPVGEEYGAWAEQDYSSEFWRGDKQLLDHKQGIDTFLAQLPTRRIRRDALRALRGSMLRTELYALDGTAREEQPYTVTESAYALREIEPQGDTRRLRIFFPHAVAQRTTQWERGDDPMTRFRSTSDYDDYGQPRRTLGIACPRGWRHMSDALPSTYLATLSLTEYASPQDPDAYIHDRVAKTTGHEVINEPGTARTLQQIIDLAAAAGNQRLIAQSLNFYDGNVTPPDFRAFVGLPFGQVGRYGVSVRTDTLVMTDEIVQGAYRPSVPPYFVPGTVMNPTSEYPADFVNNLPALGGYTHQAGGTHSPFARGYFVTAAMRYDFHSASGTGRGLVLAQRDPLRRDTTVSYDAYGLLPAEATDAVGLQTKAQYNYRVLQPREVTDPNGNRTRVNFAPIGLPTDTRILGNTSSEGDQQRPSVTMEYDLLAFSKRREPVYVRTLRQLHHDTETDVPLPQRDEAIETREYSDGFGRLLQTRAQAEAVRFGHAVFGGGEALLPVKQDDGTGGDVVGRHNTDPMRPDVVVSGWQVYDNKGRVVEKYEPFFSEGWSYTPPTDDQLGQKAKMFYDPRGQVIRTLNPDGSEQRVIYGIPDKLDDPTNPDEIRPTPWEAYTYDANDNAGRTHSNDSKDYRHHWNTPASILIDALGRAVVAVERNRAKPASSTDALPVVEEYRTVSTYDIQGNLLKITDSLNRVAFSHAYDLAKRPLRIDSIDAGRRTMVSDAIGNELERRDSKGALALRSYDILHRPDRIWARNDAAQSMKLREMLGYGDGGRSDQPAQERAASRANNSLGKLVLHKDEAGELRVGPYDFKGNLLAKTRRVIADAPIVAALDASGGPARSFTVNWNSPPSLGGAYETSMTYDALNRIKIMRYPQDVGGPQLPPSRKILRPHYNRAGVMERVTLDTAIYVERIAYNAKGQRILIAYGNGIMTRYAYDPTTFRLARLRTERYANTATTYTPSGAPLQDFAYEYDLAGNILAVHDRVPGCGVNGSVDGSDALNRGFQYDPLYRLTRATGRESIDIANPRPWTDLARNGYNSGKHGTANQDNAPSLTRQYWEEYRYDPAGNMLSLKHSNNWTRYFGMGGFTPKQWRDKVSVFLAGGSPVWGTQGNRLTNFGTAEIQARSHTFDSNGNLARELTNRHFSWDYADRMIAFADRATATSPASKEAIYLYDAGGQRIKKLVRRQTGEVETTTYIDGIFEHHRWSKPSQPTIENNTLHVMDNQSRIAMVRVGNAFVGDGAPQVSVKYNLGDHLGSSSIVIGGATATGNTFINREEYFPYGETSFGSFGRKRYRFTGKERDEESGFYYHVARYYLPWLGRWLSCDPAGTLDGLNLYVYALNDPVNYVDHDGRQSSSESANINITESLTVTENQVCAGSLDTCVTTSVTVTLTRVVHNVDTGQVDVESTSVTREQNHTVPVNQGESPTIQPEAVHPSGQTGSSNWSTWDIIKETVRLIPETLSKTSEERAESINQAFLHSGQSEEQARTNTGTVMKTAQSIGYTAGSMLAGGMAKAFTPKTHVVYGGFERSSGRVVYVGRASGVGTPAKVVAGRVQKGHILKGNADVEARPIMTLPSKDAAKGAEGALHDYLKPRNGGTWLNSPLSPPLGKSAGRLENSFSRFQDYSKAGVGGQACFSTGCPAADKLMQGVLQRSGF